jgi:hypothetical protein
MQMRKELGKWWCGGAGRGGILEARLAAEATCTMEGYLAEVVLVGNAQGELGIVRR